MPSSEVFRSIAILTSAVHVGGYIRVYNLYILNGRKLLLYEPADLGVSLIQEVNSASHTSQEQHS
jgi:hypothetical protein